jgi:hypothetical protein
MLFGEKLERRRDRLPSAFVQSPKNFKIFFSTNPEKYISNTLRQKIDEALSEYLIANI